MFEIIPSPGTEDKEWSAIEKKIELVKPQVKTIHIDVIDGKFAKNTTFHDPAPFKKYTKDLLFEVHLMVEDPLQYVKAWADAGFRRFIGQIEKMPDQVAFVAEAEQYGEVALALDKETPVDALKVSLEDLDALLVMTIQAGFSGQEFIPDLLEKVKKLREKTYAPIEVDGGISDKTILEAAHAGANRFVATSFVFGSDAPQKQLELLENILEKTGE